MLYQLEDEDGNVVDCELITELTVNDYKYYVFVPIGEEEAVILKLEDEENEVLAEINDDEEWDSVVEAFQTYLETEDYN